MTSWVSKFGSFTAELEKKMINDRQTDGQRCRSCAVDILGWDRAMEARFLDRLTH